MDQREILLERLNRTFPQLVPASPVAPHDCPECSEIRAQLEGLSWSEVPLSYIEEHDDILPLLSIEARHAFLPAWLRAALVRPESLVGGMLMAHLSLQPPSNLFNAKQARTVIAVVEWLCQSPPYGPDPVSMDSLAAIRAVWQPAAA
jgi:hypothetical protein